MVSGAPLVFVLDRRAETEIVISTGTSGVPEPLLKILDMLPHYVAEVGPAWARPYISDSTILQRLFIHCILDHSNISLFTAKRLTVIVMTGISARSESKRDRQKKVGHSSLFFFTCT